MTESLEFTFIEKTQFQKKKKPKKQKQPCVA